MDPGVSWSRVRALPFFNMSHIRQLMQGNPVYGYGNRDFVNRDFVNADFENNREDYDYDRSENMEDESNIRIPTFDDLLRRKKPETEDTAETETYSGLSGDSLAFTLVYVSVFSVTLLYVGLKLAKRWRDRQNRAAPDQPGTPGQLPPCGHPQCSRTSPHSQSRNYLPYTGLGGAWIPEILTLQGLPLPHAQPHLHNTAVCRGRCSACRSMALPPPSYNNLFLEEQPPAYDDSVVIKENEIDALVQTVDRTEECNSCTVDIECEEPAESDAKEDASINSDQAKADKEDSPEESLLNKDNSRA